jgi:hypothetical protein
MKIENAEKLTIPKYIATRIEKRDLQVNPTPNAHLRFYSYLMIWKRKELLKITVALKHYRKKLYMKIVAIHAVHSDICFVCDMEYNYFGAMGFRVGWYKEGICKHERVYERGWLWANDKYYDPFAPIVNTELIDKLPEYKYSAYRQYPYQDLFKYLRIYEQFPQAEMFAKFGLSAYALSKQLLKKVGADKKFRTWLLQHRSELSYHQYYVGTILQSYKTGKSLSETQKFEQQKKSFCRKASGYPELRAFFKGRTDKFLDYIQKQNTDFASYNDYYRACTYLQMDMTEDKNVFPHDFRHWHDMRIDQYHTAKAMKDAEERQELYAKFAAVAEKYLPLQRNNKAFVVIIAKTPNELIHEGDILHHCVGRMNYDQKFAREESLIFFLRNADKPDTPFVTIEYSLKSKKVLQCYGDKDSKPSESVLEFVHTKWLPYANRKLKKIAA